MFARLNCGLTVNSMVIPVGATIGRPFKLWLNHKFNICFLYENYWSINKIIDKPNGRTQFAPTEYKENSLFPIMNFLSDLRYIVQGWTTDK